nr:VanZ family protein [Photobacterium sp. BZF1]
MDKTFGVFSGYIYQVESGLGGAYVLHVLVATVLGFSACLASDREPTGESSAKSWAKLSGEPENNLLPGYSLVVLSIVLVSIDEFLQAFSPTREFSVWDWVANVAGITVGCSIFVLVKYAKG